ncbi:host specificity factor TipJ family phage tail protein [Luteibacter sp. PPL201]|uniref:Host specificity factor TipJ family phage tail protein n=1 Tax=Luteibacter sahnii TaxID=3021977 RepID=A0ABT6B7S3_9GAMM
MHATFVHVRDPFRHHVNRYARPVTRRTRIDTLLRQQGLIIGRGRRMRRTSPFVVASGANNFLLEKEWKRCVAAGELITVVALPKGGSALRTIALVVVAVVAAWVTGGAGGALVAGSFSATAAGAAVAIAGSMLVNAVLPLPKPPTGSTDTKSGAYGIGAKNNSARLLQSIPVMYGRFNVTPDYAALPYTEFQGNNQTLYSLLAISQGQIADPQIRIGETPIDNFDEVAYEIIPPGGTVTLFPDNVVTSDAVQGLELKRPGEGGDWMGPYVANPAGTVTQQLAVDVGFASGIYRINGDGKEKAAVASWEIQAQRIDDNGNPVGDWFKGVAQKVQKDDRTPGLFDTYTFQVPEGRYQVRGRAYDTEQGGGTVVNAVTWVGLRAYLPSKRTYGDLTLLAVRIKATNNINSSTAKAINVTATRMLPVWTGSAWTAPQATRSPAWALADILRNTTYGRGWADNRLNLPELVRLAGVWAARGDTFDGVFDTKTSLWDALSSVARVGRAVPMYYAGVVDIVRDEPRDEVPLVITPDKITAGSFSVDYAFPSQDTPDHVVVSYIDDQTWKAQTVVCALGNSPKLKPKNITLMGVTSRDQAFREGIYMAACNRDQRKFPTVTTEMEGYIPKFGDLVSLSHDVPAWGESGVVMDFDPATNTITTSEPTQWFVGQPHYLRLARRNGSQDGPYLVTKGSDDFTLVLRCLTDAQKAALWFGDGFSEDRTVYQFGPANKESQECLVIKSRPDGTGKVTLSLVNYAYSVYVAENDVNVPPPGSGSLLLDQPAAPSVGGVGVRQDADTQLVWLYVAPVPGAVTYEFQISYDGGLTWISVGIVRTNSVQVRIPGGTWIVRARAYGAGGIGGPWNQNPVNVPGLPPVLGSLTNFVPTPMVMAILLTWQLPERLNLIGADAVEIYFATTPNRSQAVPLATVPLPANSYTLSNLKAGVELYFWARIRGTDTGNYGPEIGPVHGESSSDAAQILDYLTGKVTSTQLAQDLLAKFDAIDQLQDFIQAAEWASGTAYAVGSIVAHGDRLYRAVQAVPTSGPEPGTDATYWRDIGARVQTAAGLVGSIYDTNLQVQNLGQSVQATATRTDAVFAQLNPKSAGELTSAGDGSAGNMTTMPTAGYYSYVIAQVQNDRALGERIDTLGVTVGGYQSQIQTVQQAQASLDGKVSASYVVKTEVAANGQRILAGIAIGSDYSGGTVTSQVIVNAATFAVMDASSGSATARIPFLVQSGQVFLDVAFIADGTITDAKIGNQIKSTAVNSSNLPVWEINKNGTRYVRGNQFTITEDVNGWRMSNGSFNVIEIGVLS